VFGTKSWLITHPSLEQDTSAPIAKAAAFLVNASTFLYLSVKRQ
jgi:hypothetical protein